MLLKTLLRNSLSQRIRPHTIIAGRLRGARMVTSWHDYPAGIIGRTEAPLLSWLDAHVMPGTTWLDVGAHYGYTAIALSRLVGPHGRVFAFEPVPATAACLARTCGLNGLHQTTVIGQGLGAPRSLEWLTLPRVRGMADSTPQRSHHARHERITIARFDWLWPQVNGGHRRIDGVKIDVQGMEVHVLRGMRVALTQQRPLLVVEVHEGVDRRALVHVLASCGYDDAPVPIERAETGRDIDLRSNVSYAFFPAAAAASVG